MKIAFSLLLVLLTAAAALAQEAKPQEQAEPPRIELADAKQAFDKKTAVFVDARAEDAYRAEHIKGAINIPLTDPPDLTSLPTGKTIIVYCSWPSEHTSARLAQIMIEKGIKNVFALKGGIQAWLDAKYPKEKSN